MHRKPAAPSNLRNGLKWRDGRPRWEPSPANRACGFAGMDLRDHEGRWMERGAATTAADARTLWAKLVREAMRDDVEGSKARGMLAAALERLPVARPEPEHQHSRALVADLIERGRAVIEMRDPRLQATPGPRSVQAMIDGFFADRRAMADLAVSSQRAYRSQSKRIAARFGATRVDEVTKADLRDWYRDLCEETSIANANQVLGVAGALFRWATWQNPPWLLANPTSDLGRKKAPGRRVFWEFEEERLFIAWCDANGFVDVADCAAVCLWTGARQVDVAAANLSDLSGATWRFVPTKTAKSGQEALPGLLQPVKTRVERRRAAAETDAVRHLNDAPFLWDNRQQRRHTSETIGKRFAYARELAVRAGAVPEGFALKRLQDTRDTCVTRLFDAGVPLHKIPPWTGHTGRDAENILRDHYLSLREAGALETAATLERYAQANGFALAAG